MPDEGRKDGEEEADAARGPHPGHARAATRDRSVHSRHRSLQVEQVEVRGSPEDGAAVSWLFSAVVNTHHTSDKKKESLLIAFICLLKFIAEFGISPCTEQRFTIVGASEIMLKMS